MKNDAAETLPKIAERHATVVEDAAEASRPRADARFGRNALQDGPAFQQELEEELRRRDLDPAPHGMEAPASFGAVEDRALADRVAAIGGLPEGKNWKAPFLGAGHTGGGVPEWIAGPTELPHNAEIWKITKGGTETPLGFRDAHAGPWKPYVKTTEQAARP
ncbi:hypothetical protein [Kitasatospora sp. NPDC088134]|uniref:hypothetical protein n=1 Tax=Kitasatospora sp. NPDC088134 TaxID=3364071 RepID=UPI00381DE2B1